MNFVRKSIVNSVLPWHRALLSTIVRNSAGPLLFGSEGGFDVTSSSWDNLIIFDACRYDAFKEIVPPIIEGGNLEEKISRGSDTLSFLTNNFGWKAHKDIVYVTANPVVNIALPHNFHAIISVWNYDWDDNYQTVFPENLCERAVQASIQYPGKKLVIHFLQPHSPYISRPPFRPNGNESHRVVKDGESGERAFKILGCQISLGSLTFSSGQEEFLPFRDRILPYKQDLKRAATALRDTLPRLKGRTIITSDHGEAFGDKIHNAIPLKLYGHIGLRMPILTQVPWYVLGESTIRDGRLGNGGDHTNHEELTPPEQTNVLQRLRQLGYL